MIRQQSRAVAVRRKHIIVDYTRAWRSQRVASGSGGECLAGSGNEIYAEHPRTKTVRGDKRKVVSSIILGRKGTAFIEFGVPVIDGVGAPVKQAEALVALGLTTSKRGAYAAPAPKRFSGTMASFSTLAAEAV